MYIKFLAAAIGQDIKLERCVHPSPPHKKHIYQHLTDTTSDFTLAETM